MVVVYRSNFMLHFHYCLDLFSFAHYPIACDELLRKYCSRFPLRRSASNGSCLHLRHIVTLHNCVQISSLKPLGSINHCCKGCSVPGAPESTPLGSKGGWERAKSPVWRVQGTGRCQEPQRSFSNHPKPAETTQVHSSLIFKIAQCEATGHSVWNGRGKEPL